MAAGTPSPAQSLRNCLQNPDFWRQSTPFGIGPQKTIVFGEYDSVRKTFHEEWESEQALGQGGFGSVFRCRGKRNAERVVALKAVSVKSLDEALDVARNEVAGLMSLEHPSIVKVRGGFIPYQQALLSPRPMPLVCILMEFVEGRNLQDILQDRDIYPLIPLQLKMRWMLLLVDALEYLASRKVVHNDLKPANIMISVDGSDTQVKIVDFGLARYDPTGPMPAGGTLPWLPPEHPFWRQPTTGGITTSTRYHPSHKGDLWALGVIIYQIFATDNNWLRDYRSMAMALLHPMKPLPRLLEEKIPYAAVRLLLAKILTPLPVRPDIGEVKELLRFAHRSLMDDEFDVTSWCEAATGTHKLEISSTAMLLECGSQPTERALKFLAYWSQKPNALECIRESALPSLLKLIPDVYTPSAGSAGLMELLQGMGNDSLTPQLGVFLELLAQTGDAAIMKDIFTILLSILNNSTTPAVPVNILNSGKVFAVVSQHMRHSAEAALVVEALTDEFPCLHFLDRRMSLHDRLIDGLTQETPHAAVGFLSRLPRFGDTPVALFLRAAIEHTRFKSLVFRDVLRYHRDTGALVTADDAQLAAAFADFITVCQGETNPFVKQWRLLLLGLVSSPASEEALLKHCAAAQVCSRRYALGFPVFQPAVLCRTCSTPGNPVRVCLPCRNLCHHGHQFGITRLSLNARVSCACALRGDCRARDDVERPLACPSPLEVMSPDVQGLHAALCPPQPTRGEADEAVAALGGGAALVQRPAKFSWNGTFNQRNGRLCFPLVKSWACFPVLGVQLPVAPTGRRRVLFYCEMFIDHLPPRGPDSPYLSITLGFSPGAVASKASAVGWEPGQVGYHNDDGNLYAGRGDSALLPAFGPQFGEGDVVGAGIFSDGQPFFTHNGVYLAYSIPADKFLVPNRRAGVTYFCVSASTPAVCHLRFRPADWALQSVPLSSAQMWPFPINVHALRLVQQHFPDGPSRHLAADATDFEVEAIQLLWRLIAKVLREKNTLVLGHSFEAGSLDLNDLTGADEMSIICKYSALSDVPLAQLEADDTSVQAAPAALDNSQLDFPAPPPLSSSSSAPPSSSFAPPEELPSQPITAEQLVAPPPNFSSRDAFFMMQQMMRQIGAMQEQLNSVKRSN